MSQVSSEEPQGGGFSRGATSGRVLITERQPRARPAQEAGTTRGVQGVPGVPPRVREDRGQYRHPCRESRALLWTTCQGPAGGEGDTRQVVMPARATDGVEQPWLSLPISAGSLWVQLLELLPLPPSTPTSHTRASSSRPWIRSSVTGSERGEYDSAREKGSHPKVDRGHHTLWGSRGVPATQTMVEGRYAEPPIFVFQVAEGQKGERCPPDPRSTALRLHHVDGARPEPHPSPSSWRMRAEDWPPERSGELWKAAGRWPQRVTAGLWAPRGLLPKTRAQPRGSPPAHLPPAPVLTQLLWPQAASSKDVPPRPPIPQPRRVSARNKP